MLFSACSISKESSIEYTSLTDTELEERISKKDVEAILEKASRLYEEESYEKAVDYFKKAAEAGNAIGQYHLGFYYLKNSTTPKQWSSIKKQQSKNIQLLYVF